MLHCILIIRGSHLNQIIGILLPINGIYVPNCSVVLVYKPPHPASETGSLRCSVAGPIPKRALFDVAQLINMPVRFFCITPDFLSHIALELTDDFLRSQRPLI